jgi:spore coat polysaccharide biosynthesis protein SpsF
MNARIGVIIFARMTSRRLPGKALQPVGDRPLLGRVIDRSRRITKADGGITLAISKDSSDDPMVDFACRENVNVFRGSLSDVALRAFECAAANGWMAFARVCGDRPFLDPDAVDAAIDCMLQESEPPDLVTNVLDGPVPAGMTVEVMGQRGLAKVLQESAEPEDREHVTRYVYSHPDRFRIARATPVAAATLGLRFAVDTQSDLEAARYVVERLPNPAAASIFDVARLVRECWTH